METHNDLELTEQETETVFKYWGKQSQDYINRVIEQKKARKFVDLFCDQISNETKNRGNCYNVGTIVWRRKDNTPIQESDFNALKKIDHGQCNKFTLSDDQMTMTHYWECDSGD